MVSFAPEPLIACLLAQSDVVPRNALLRLKMVRDDQRVSPSNAWAALVEGAGDEVKHKNECAGDEDEHKNEERDGTLDYLLRALEAPTPAFEMALLSDGVLATEIFQELSQSLPGGPPNLSYSLDSSCAMPHRTLHASDSTHTLFMHRAPWERISSHAAAADPVRRSSGSALVATEPHVDGADVWRRSGDAR
jgi:hypothetical protein